MAPEQITNLIRQWTQAELQADTAALDRLLAADFAGVGPRGFVLTREQWLARYRSGDLHNESFALEEPAVRVYGETAVVVGIQNQRTTFQGHDAGGRFRTTLICARQDGDWRIAGWQASGPIPATPPQQG
jgi:ketosteroid isomerase-like protein